MLVLQVLYTAGILSAACVGSAAAALAALHLADISSEQVMMRDQ